MEEIEIQSIEPNVETAENRYTPTSEEISKIVGFKVDNGVPASSDPDPAKPETPVSDEPENPNPTPDPEDGTPSPDPEETSTEEESTPEINFWGEPDENGNYIVSQDKLDELREVMDKMDGEQRQIYNDAVALRNSYEQRYQEAIKHLNQVASDYIARHGATATPQPTPPNPAEKPNPKLEAIEKAKAAMLEQAKIAIGDPKIAENFVESQITLLKAMADDGNAKSTEQAELLKPYIDRLEQNAYREDLFDTYDNWSEKIYNDLKPFGISQEGAGVLVEKYMEAANAQHILKFGRPLSIDELNAKLQQDQTNLVVATLLSQIENGQAEQPAPQGEKPNPLKTIPKRATPPQSIPSTVAAQRSVATGDALRAMNDASITGVGGGVSTGDSSKAQYLSDLKKIVGVNFSL